jgi:hypothetical protein
MCVDNIRSTDGPTDRPTHPIAPSPLPSNNTNPLHKPPPNREGHWTDKCPPTVPLAGLPPVFGVTLTLLVTIDKDLISLSMEDATGASLPACEILLNVDGSNRGAALAKLKELALHLPVKEETVGFQEEWVVHEVWWGPHLPTPPAPGAPITTPLGPVPLPPPGPPPGAAGMGVGTGGLPPAGGVTALPVLPLGGGPGVPMPMAPVPGMAMAAAPAAEAATPMAAVVAAAAVAAAAKARSALAHKGAAGTCGDGRWGCVQVRVFGVGSRLMDPNVFVPSTFTSTYTRKPSGPIRPRIRSLPQQPGGEMWEEGQEEPPPPPHEEAMDVAVGGGGGDQDEQAAAAAAMEMEAATGRMGEKLSRLGGLLGAGGAGAGAGAGPGGGFGAGLAALGAGGGGGGGFAFGFGGGGGGGGGGTGMAVVAVNNVPEPASAEEAEEIKGDLRGCVACVSVDGWVGRWIDSIQFDPVLSFLQPFEHQARLFYPHHYHHHHHHYPGSSARSAPAPTRCTSSPGRPPLLSCWRTRRTWGRRSAPWIGANTRAASSGWPAPTSGRSDDGPSWWWW